MPVRGPGAAEPDDEEVACDREEPRSKKPRTEELRRVDVVASLEGIEARLQNLGETPRFRAVRTGLLQHKCTTAEAIVSFWPGTLSWSVEGRQRCQVEDALLAPVCR